MEDIEREKEVIAKLEKALFEVYEERESLTKTIEYIKDNIKKSKLKIGAMLQMDEEAKLIANLPTGDELIAFQENCSHLYCRSLNQPYPRLCIKCRKQEQND